MTMSQVPVGLIVFKLLLNYLYRLYRLQLITLFKILFMFYTDSGAATSILRPSRLHFLRPNGNILKATTLCPTH